MISKTKKKYNYNYKITRLQKISLNIIFILSILTFLFTGLQVKLWQSSKFLLSSVLPAVVVDLTNEERKHNNVGLLYRNKLLDEAAQLKAEDMAAKSYFSHNSPDGKTPWYWFDKVGYKYSHAGENLAIHFSDSKELVDSWIKSTPHHKNIISDKFTDIGIGVAEGYFEGKKTVYIVQLFGKRLDEYKEKESILVDNNLSSKIITSSDIKNITEKSDNNNLIKGETIGGNTINDKQNTKVIKKPDKKDLLNNHESNDNTTFPKIKTDLNVSRIISGKKNHITEEKTSGKNIPQNSKTQTKSKILTRNKVKNDANHYVHNKNKSEGKLFSGYDKKINTSILSESVSLDVVNDQKSAVKKLFVLTQPGKLMQTVYKVLAISTISMLLLSLILEIRRRHFIHIVYSFGLLLFMFGLWTLHSWLISEAVIL